MALKNSFDNKTFFERLEKKKIENKGKQFTRHQDDAIEISKLFNDTTKRSIGIYMRLFKKYPREDLFRCRDWVLSKNCKEPGRVFVAAYKKFV